jgi:diguanylate cyclase
MNSLLSLFGLLAVLSTVTTAFSFALLIDASTKVRAADRALALGWWVLGSAGVASGLWCGHLLLLAGFATEGAATPSLLALLGTWVVAATGIAAALAVARNVDSRRQRALVLSLMTALLSVALAALVLPLPDRWLGDPWLTGVGTMLATAALAAMAFRWRPERSADGHPPALRLIAGSLFAVGLLAGEWMAHAPDGLIAADALPATDLRIPLLLAGFGAMALTLISVGAAIDRRLRGRTTELAGSLSEANTRLRDLAMRDPLTRLPNRLQFEESLTDMLARASGEASLAVLFIDLDGFKPINDSFGHVVGDSVLCEIGRRLKSLVRDGEAVARVGGDEFLMLVDRPVHADAVAELAQRVLSALVRPYRMPNGLDVELSCSVGIALHPQHGPASKLIANADAAMYAAKRAGGATYAFFEPCMELDARDQLELQHDLRAALEHNQLELYYQPKVDGRSGQITGAEALLRWHHPRRGLVSPGVFVPVAERFGMISQVGSWVIEEACRQVRAWLDGGLRIRVAVNLSVHQLRQEDLVDRILDAVARHRIDAALLTFEITESVAMEDTQITQRAFEQLARTGAILSIDDFGTGYSSLAYLRKLPAKQLKIDRSFVSDLDQSSDALAVVDAVIRLAHALGLRVVAEGVETERQRDILLRLRCDELQGFLFAKPMPARMLTFWAMDADEPAHPDFRPSTYTGFESSAMH